MRKLAWITWALLVGLPAVGRAAADPQTLEELRRLYAPKVVGVPPENACHGLMVMPDGEIRHYGLCYLHLQSAASEADPFGVLIESVAACSTE
jgi:hypothetical protein